MNSCSSCVINNWRIEQISRKRLMLRAFRLFFLSITFSFYTSAHVSITSMKNLILTFIFSLKARAWHRSNMIMCNSFIVLSDKKESESDADSSNGSWHSLLYKPNFHANIFCTREQTTREVLRVKTREQVNTTDFRAKLVPS